MKYAAVGLALLFTPLMLAAQNPAKTESPILILQGIPATNGCPISMHASHGAWDHSVEVRQGKPEPPLQHIGQRILLSLVDAHPAPITTATVKVIGLTGKNQMLQTAAANSEGDGVKTLTVTFTRGQDNSVSGAVSGDLYVPGFTAVTSVELLEVSYADGKTWKVGAPSVCRVTPDRLMLVAAH